MTNAGYVVTAECDAVVMDSLPSGAVPVAVYYFPSRPEGGGKDGVIVKIRPRVGMPWIGVFAFGMPVGTALTGLYACPDPKSVCVVASGQAVVVQSDAPMRWSLVPAKPVLDVLPVPSGDILLFVANTFIVAWGKNGVIWRTGRLSWDGLELLEVTSERISGTGWDPNSPIRVGFTVDLRTGQHEGGSSPATYGKARR